MRLLLALFSLLTIYSLQSFALDKDLGAFYKFSTHMYMQNNNKICNVYTRPATQSGIIRGDTVSLNITNRPYKKSKNKLAIDMAIPLQAGSKVFVKTKRKTYTLFTDLQYAFPYDKDEVSIIKALKNSNSARIVATAKNGKKISDVYSMRGVTKAIRAIDRACRKP